MSESLYARVGGAGVVDRIVDFIYNRIRTDPELWEPIFQHVPMGVIKAKFRLWLTAKLGGPSTYAGDMVRHRHWRITDRMFNRVADYALAGFMCEHVEKEILVIVESVVLAERPAVVSKA